VHSGFAEARVLEIATQLRPTLPDNLPAVRCLGPRSLQVNGLYRHGFLIAPAMLDVVLELMQQGRSPMAEQLGLNLEQAGATRAA
jgi:glycine oxidase